MNNEDIEKIFESKLNDNFYISNNKLSYTLKECLEKANDKVLDLLYFNYFALNGNKTKKLISRKGKIDFLFLNLPKRFAKCFDITIGNDMGIFKDCLNNKITNTYNEMLLTNGFMFGFRENEKKIYIVPIEYLKIYKKMFSEVKQKKIIKQNAINYIQSYLLINGIIPRKILFDFIIKKHKLDITTEELDEIIKTQNITIYKNYYLILYDNTVNLDLLIQAKQKLPYYYLEGDKLISYLNFFNNFYFKLAKILKNDNKAKLVLSNILISFSSIDENLKSLVKGLDLSDKEKKKLENLFDISWSRLRFWTLNGRTILSFKNELLIEQVLLNSKPKEPTVECCLNSLSKEQYQTLLKLYELRSDVKAKEFANIIINNFNANIYKYSDKYLRFLILTNNNLLKNNSLEYFDITQVYVFTYKDNKNKKIIIPKEILDVIKHNINK